MFTLVIFKKDGTRQDIPLKSGSYIFGRKPEADVRVPVNEVSRSHCELSINGTKALIKDLGSSNGTYVNDRRIAAETSLNAGDHISVGPATFILQIDGKPTDIAPPSHDRTAAAARPDAATKVSSPTKSGPPAKPAAPAKSGPPAKGPAKPATTSKPIDEDDFDIDDLSDLDVNDLSDFDLEEISDLEDIDDDALADDVPAKKVPEKNAPGASPPKGKGPDKKK